MSAGRTNEHCTRTSKRSWRAGRQPRDQTRRPGERHDTGGGPLRPPPPPAGARMPATPDTTLPPAVREPTPPTTNARPHATAEPGGSRVAAESGGPRATGGPALSLADAAGAEPDVLLADAA